MKKNTKKIVKVVISLIYIVWGLLSPVTAIKAILDLDLSAIIAVIPSILMLIVGILGLFGIKPKTCHALGVVVFVLALISAVFAVLGSGLVTAVSPIITALLAWLFIVCL